MSVGAGQEAAVSSWARASVEEAVLRAFIVGVGVWQCVLITAIVTSDPLIPQWILLAVEAGVVGLIWGVSKGWVHPGLILLASGAEILLCFDAAAKLNSVLAFASAWTANLMGVMAVLVLPRWWGAFAAVVSAFALAIGVHVLRPEWGIAQPRGILVTDIAVAAIGYVIWRRLTGYADAVDQANEAAERERRRTAAMAVVASEVAEDTRVLHDTVINTLGYIASGAVGTDDERVRARCRDDLDRLDLLGGTHSQVAATDDLGVQEVAERLNVRLVVQGMPFDERARQLALIPAATERALRGACHELILNAAKHSGSDRVTVRFEQCEQGLVVTVADYGVGMTTAPQNGRGFAESVLGRAEGAGIDVTWRSSPGSGLTVQLTYPIGHTTAATTSAARDDVHLSVQRTVAGLRRGATFAACVSVVAVGIVIEIANHPGRFTTAYAMLALDAVMSLVAWSTTRRGRDLPATAAYLTALSIPAGFVFAAGAVDFGRADVTTWQAVGIIPLFVIVERLSPTRGPYRLACVALAATVVVLTVMAEDRTPTMASIVVLGAAPLVIFLGGWRVFLSLTESIARQLARAKQDLLDAELAVAGASEAMAWRRRWVDAALASARALLSDLARGRRLASDPQTRAACAREERYLREITMMTTRAVRLSPWLARAVVEARSRAVKLVVRVGDDIDARNDDEAALLGSVVLQKVSSAEPDTSVNVGFFGSAGSDQLLVVGPLSAVPTALDVVPEDWTIRCQEFESQTLLEVRWPSPIMP